ncbi:MAG: polysaccharide deacetylase family protein [Actinomycetia bacterium]|nr:polysaccharide deacetylase family protein [Actinomycetes bacterium]
MRKIVIQLFLIAFISSIFFNFKYLQIKIKNETIKDIGVDVAKIVYSSEKKVIKKTTNPPLSISKKKEPEEINNPKNNEEPNPAPYLNQIIKRAPNLTDEIVLTFDDGPSDNTLKIVEILKQYDVKATFFFVGKRIIGKSDIIKKVTEAGMEIGNHSYNHIDLKNLTKETVLAEIRKTEEVIISSGGEKPVFLRPPAGHYDWVALEAAKELNYIFTLWSVHGQDTRKITEKEIASGVIRHTQGGAIVLLHETNPKTIQALPVILEGLAEKGLKPVTISELLDL